MANYKWAGTCVSDEAIVSLVQSTVGGALDSAGAEALYNVSASLDVAFTPDRVLLNFSAYDASANAFVSGFTSQYQLETCTTLGPIDATNWSGVYSLELVAAMITATWAVWGLAFLARTSWRLFR